MKEIHYQYVSTKSLAERFLTKVIKAGYSGIFVRVREEMYEIRYWLPPIKG